MRKIDQAYEFIKSYIESKGYPPTIREIGDAIGIKSTSTVSYYLDKLEESNKIIKGSYKNRSIKLTSETPCKADVSNIIPLPLLTGVKMGFPLLHEQNVKDTFVVSGSMFKGLEMFLLLVKDDSMAPGGIFKNDMVVVSRQNVARNGEIVVALFDGEYTVARLYKEFKFFRLQPDNSKYSPLYAEKIVILGKVVGVIRNEIN